MEKKRIGWSSVIAAAAVVVLGIFSFPKIAQDHEYHDFAGDCPWMGIPNGANVLTNLAFCIVGGMGLVYVFRHRNIFLSRLDRILWLIFFAAAFGVGIGSGYYHLAPDNETLFWDRLPMSVAFMALLAIVIGERASKETARFAAPLLLLIGAGTVLYWRFTELVGAGDLRPYIAVQFFPIVAIPLLALLVPIRRGDVRPLYFAVVCYAGAKFFEICDHPVYAWTGGWASGHPLKHLAAAAGVYFVFRYLKSRA